MVQYGKRKEVDGLPNKEWHPLFVTSLKEALSDALPGEVEIQPEVALSSKPLDVDVIVVKKSETARLSHPLTNIFKKYNLFEFKSPDDRLEPNDYDKGMAIAILYKAIEHKEMLKLDQITVTFVSKKHPRVCWIKGKREKHRLVTDIEC